MTPVRTKWWGPDRHVVIYFVTANCDELYFVTNQPEDAGWMTPESWSQKGDLRVLREAGWVDTERRGTWIYYSLRTDAVERFSRLTGSLGVTPSSRRLPVLDSVPAPA